MSTRKPKTPTSVTRSETGWFGGGALHLTPFTGPQPEPGPQRAVWCTICRPRRQPGTRGHGGYPADAVFVVGTWLVELDPDGYEILCDGCMADAITATLGGGTDEATS